jgi:hypothetical protein
MQEQLLHLLFLDTRPCCSVRVVPISTGAWGLNVNSFRIMQYPDHSPVVYVEMMTTSLFLEHKKDLDAYERRLGMLGQVALDEGPSRELLAQLASEYDRVDVGIDESGWSAAGAPQRLAQE